MDCPIVPYFPIIFPLTCPCLANLPAVFDDTRVMRATLGRRCLAGGGG